MDKVKVRKMNSDTSGESSRKYSGDRGKGVCCGEENYIIKGD